MPDADTSEEELKLRTKTVVVICGTNILCTREWKGSHPRRRSSTGGSWSKCQHPIFASFHRCVIVRSLSGQGLAEIEVTAELRDEK
jgi:hypothetical protein